MLAAKDGVLGDWTSTIGSLVVMSKPVLFCAIVLHVG